MAEIPAYFSSENQEERGIFEDLSIYECIILKCILKSWDKGCGKKNNKAQTLEQLAWSCGYCVEHPGFLKR